MDFYNSFLEYYKTHLTEQFNSLGTHLPAAVLVSPAVVKLKKSDLGEIETFVRECFKISRSSDYESQFEDKTPPTGRHKVKNFSALMSYDFHITQDGPKLIEINTNASLSSLAYVLSEFQNSNSAFSRTSEGFLTKIRKTFESELMLFSGAKSSDTLIKKPRVVICDEKPEQQRAYTEFLFYKSLFESWGWACEIADCADLVFSDGILSNRLTGNEVHFVYNRSTDFYFEQKASEGLRNAYLANAACISPNPQEYALLAEKTRLFTLCQYDNLKKIIPEVRPIETFDRIGSKKEREKYFFKPLRSFGAKAVYRGKSLSQKLFEELLLQNYMAMELVEPPTLSVETQTGPQEFKWDLRAYAYKDEVQMLVARLYQGQMTNTNTLGGGLAAISLI